MGDVDADILRIVRRLERTHGRVYPFMVGPWLDYYRCEQTLRRDMARLAASSYLIRVGGWNERKGYQSWRPVRARQQWRSSLHLVA